MRGTSARVVAPSFLAKMVAVFYVVLLVSGFDMFFVFGKLVVRSDAAATAANILAHEAMFLYPPLAHALSSYIVLSSVGEVLLVLWLAVKGVDDQRWQEQAAAGPSKELLR